MSRRTRRALSGHLRVDELRAVAWGGRKERSISLWPKTAEILKEWFHEIDWREDATSFPDVRRALLTRFDRRLRHLDNDATDVQDSTAFFTAARRRPEPREFRMTNDVQSLSGEEGR